MPRNKTLVKALEQNIFAKAFLVKHFANDFIKNIFQLQQLRSSHQLLGAREAPPDYTTVSNQMMTMMMMVVVMVMIMRMTTMMMMVVVVVVTMIMRMATMILNENSVILL